MRNGFDRLARLYRWMEYLTFGRALERCRFLLLPRVAHATHALLLGDGDGRYAARLLHAAPAIHITAVDASSAMLKALQTRCAQPARITAACLNLPGTALTVTAEPYDLVVSHFFLDCLSDAQITQLIRQIKPLLAPGARWIVSEFQVPRGAMYLPAYVIVRGLYAAFRVLTGLRIQKLPEYRHAMRLNGLTCSVQINMLGGLLTAEEWHL